MRQRSASRDVWLATAAAAALVLIRSFVFFWYEQNFDSDQAIVGLMARHLSELKAFPLFFYGQNYMLGVESWLAVPGFWIGGSTVSMLRLPLLVINVVVVILLIRLLTAGGMRPGLAFMAVLPFAACGPVAAGQLLTALGASVEPLLYVIVLWLLRKRPVPFGLFLCVGWLHREFTVFAVPPILLLEWLESRSIRWPAMLQAAAASAAVWIAIDQLKRHINIAGPGGDTGPSGSLALEAVQVGKLLSFHPALYFARLQLLLTQGLPDLFGGRPLPLFVGGVWGEGNVGSWIAGAALLAAVVAGAARLLWILFSRDGRGATFPAFLLLVSLQAIVAYGLHGGSTVEVRTELNYVLLALFLPVAVFAAYFQLEASRRYLQVVVALIAVWAVPTLADNLQVARQYVVSPPPSPHRELADYLTDHRIKYAWASYWDSYRVTFLSKERVIVASTQSVRIPGYQSRVEQNRSNAARIERLPCDEGARVAEWCVVDPFQR